MQTFIVLAFLVSELARNDPPLVLNVTKKHLSSLRVKVTHLIGHAT